MKCLRMFPLLFMLGMNTCLAAIEDLEFASEQDRERYQHLIAELRCPKCLNANLAGSDAPIANDLRAEIFEQINTGNSDDEIIDYMTARYGDFILYRPPVNTRTAVLWFGPFVLLLAGLVILRRMMRKSSIAGSADSLSTEEQARLNSLLATTGNPDKDGI